MSKADKDNEGVANFINISDVYAKNCDVVFYRDMTVVSLDLIKDKCVFMDLVADTGFAYASSFHNSKEYD